LTPGDLDQMLDSINNLAQSGARSAARQALSDLENLLNNLRMSSRGAGGGPDGARGATRVCYELLQSPTRPRRQKQTAGYKRDGPERPTGPRPAGRTPLEARRRPGFFRDPSGSRRASSSRVPTQP
ncbi:MAG: DUF4175 family protein, partial [Myxococcales bacterium]|nr:DUF4175 family protein [Myxococcales bacterium]